MNHTRNDLPNGDFEMIEIKTPLEAYTDGDVGTGKWCIYVLENDPLTEGFRKWNT